MRSWKLNAELQIPMTSSLMRQAQHCYGVTVAHAAKSSITGYCMVVVTSAFRFKIMLVLSSYFKLSRVHAYNCDVIFD